MERLMKIDRRILYIIAAVLVVLTILFPLNLPIKISDMTKNCHKAVDDLPDGSLVLLCPQYDPGSAAELTPQFTAFLYQLAEAHHKIVVVSTSWPLGAELVHPIVKDILEGQYGYKYGVDYIEVGSKPGGTVWMQQVVTDFVGTCIVDRENKPLSQFPIMQQLPKVTKDYVAATIVLDCGSPGAKEFLPMINQVTGIPLIVGEVQMSIPEMMPFVSSGQIAGMIGGSRGCAEYEQLIGHPGKGTKSQDTMSVIALMTTLFVILGNIGYLARKK